VAKQAGNLLQREMAAAGSAGSIPQLIEGYPKTHTVTDVVRRMYPPEAASSPAAPPDVFPVIQFLASTTTLPAPAYALNSALVQAAVAKLLQALSLNPNKALLLSLLQKVYPYRLLQSTSPPQIPLILVKLIQQLIKIESTSNPPSVAGAVPSIFWTSIVKEQTATPPPPSALYPFLPPIYRLYCYVYNPHFFASKVLSIVAANPSKPNAATKEILALIAVGAGGGAAR
jgi:hypothetical protein